MSQVINATVEGGLLRPDRPLDLPPNTRVRLVIEPLGEDSEVADGSATAIESRPPEDQAAWDDLERLWGESDVDSGAPRPTRDDLHDRR